jgi:hypothetical protein
MLVQLLNVVDLPEPNLTPGHLKLYQCDGTHVEEQIIRPAIITQALAQNTVVFGPLHHLSL